ncbi:MAG: xanthine phosphoribosyltransferase [Acholeplasmatales bacterium]|nr:xanthine phosphoribosyltransferase [Acholeplasmatales bacterium]
MQELKDIIIKDSKAIGKNILKVDSFINHQIDTKLLDHIGAYLASKFPDATKVLTIEASGIAFGVAVASHLGFVPCVFAKKNTSKTLDEKNIYRTYVESFTHGNVNLVSVDKRFLTKDDKVLIIDDFLAEGNSALGLIDLCNQANALVLGVGIVVEKGFQKGRKRIEEAGYKVESAAIVGKIDNGKVILK